MVHPYKTYVFDRRGLGTILAGSVGRYNSGGARYEAFPGFEYSKSRNILLSMIVRERLCVFHATPESRASEWGLLSSLLISKSSGDTRWCAERAYTEFPRGLYFVVNERSHLPSKCSHRSGRRIRALGILRVVSWDERYLLPDL